MPEQQHYYHRHTKGSYHSSAATAESLDTDDSLATNITASSKTDNRIEIEGLELLLQHHLRLDGNDNDNDDFDYDGDDEDQEINTRDTEIDSLILARRRLHRIWIHRPVRRSRRKYIAGPVDSVKLARRRIPQCVHHKTRRLPQREAKLEVTFPDLDPLELTPSINNSDDDDDTDYSWDSLADKTVDSLELTRSRLEKLQQNQNRPRRHGTDLLYLGRRHRGTARIQLQRMKKPLGPIRTRFQGMVPLRQHSDGVVKLQGSYQASSLAAGPRSITKIARHNSDGRLRVGRAA